MLDAVMLLYPYMSSTNKMYSIRLPEVIQCDYEVYNMKKKDNLFFSRCWMSCVLSVYVME